jgi:anti-sigma regulatory factor (Ser/Thr protein kinase)
MIARAATETVGIRRTRQVYLDAHAKSAAPSRHFVRRVCASWQFDQERIGIAELLATELIANAIQASDYGLPSTDRRIGLRLAELADILIIEVWDASPEPPVLLHPSAEQDHGRGLQLVDALSIRWGHYSAPMGGKVVFCVLARTEAACDDSQAEEALAEISNVLQSHPWHEQTLTARTLQFRPKLATCQTRRSWADD